jgi:hypothetical protein
MEKIKVLSQAHSYLLLMLILFSSCLSTKIENTNDISNLNISRLLECDYELEFSIKDVSPKVKKFFEKHAIYGFDLNAPHEEIVPRRKLRMGGPHTRRLIFVAKSDVFELIYYQTKYQYLDLPIDTLYNCLIVEKSKCQFVNIEFIEMSEELPNDFATKA